MRLCLASARRTLGCKLNTQASGGMTVIFKYCLLLLASTISLVPVVANSQTDSLLKKAIIQESINSYSGNCPCPYNRTSNGSKCGKRSAYSRPGGSSPICYESDINSEMLKKYKVKNQK